jgi:nickel-type superoxide dismutase maturation protease
MDKTLPKAAIWDRLLLLIGRRRGFIVAGDSMLPTLKEGDRVLVDPNATLRSGDIVLADHPYKNSVRILKRVDRLEENGRLFLKGDNVRESSDSRTFGPVSKQSVRGKVTCRLGGSK